MKKNFPIEFKSVLIFQDLIKENLGYISIYAKNVESQVQDMHSLEYIWFKENNPEFKEFHFDGQNHSKLIEDPEYPAYFLILDINGRRKIRILKEGARIWNVFEDIKDSTTYSRIPLVLNGVQINNQIRDSILLKLKELEIYTISLNDDVYISSRILSHPDESLSDESVLLSNFITRATRSHLVTSFWHFIDEDVNAHSLINILLQILKLNCFNETEIIDDICKLKKVRDELKPLRDMGISHLDKKQVKKEIKLETRSITHTIQNVKDAEGKIEIIKTIMTKWISNLTQILQPLESTATDTSSKRKIYFSLTKGELQNNYK